jgi:hypothetical protein
MLFVLKYLRNIPFFDDCPLGILRGLIKTKQTLFFRFNARLLEFIQGDADRICMIRK